MTQLVTTTIHEDLAILTMDRPSALNALNGPLLDDLDIALNNAEHDSNVRVVILAGGPKAFSVGGDLKEDHANADDRVQRMHGLALRLQSYAKITIAAIEGWALGGGLEIAMGCTFRVAAPDARLGLPEIAMGLIPGFGGTQLLPRLVGTSRAIAMLCDGVPIDAATALSIGLIEHVADEPGDALACARQVAARFTVHSPAAQHAARLAVVDGLSLPLDQALAAERHHLNALRGTATTHEGILAFRQGRKNVSTT